ncbi:MAG: low molecular weight protein-tyrosine-phosphatase, partial [Nocardioides sp.]
PGSSTSPSSTMTEPRPLPPPRTPGRYRLGMVCSGNICRSPTAEVVLSARLADAGLDDLVTVESCGLGDWHVGDPMDPRSAATLTQAGYDASQHRAQQLPTQWSTEAAGLDLLIAMDAGHRRDLLAGGADAERVRLFRDFDAADPGADVPDPYYGGQHGFEEVLAMVERTSDALATALVTVLERGPDSR